MGYGLFRQTLLSYELGKAPRIPPQERWDRKGPGWLAHQRPDFQEDGEGQLVNPPHDRQSSKDWVAGDEKVPDSGWRQGRADPTLPPRPEAEVNNGPTGCSP